MRKESGFTTTQIWLTIIICVVMAVLYFAAAYIFGRSIANIVLMWGLIAAAVIVVIVRLIKGKL